MLFGYPPAANADNWLHYCVYSMLDHLHGQLLAGNPPSSWPEIIPSPHREILRRKRGLKSRFEQYSQAFTKLTTAEQNQVHLCLIQQNQLSLLFLGNVTCNRLDQLPTAVQGPIKDLFEFIFEKLPEFKKIRDTQYLIIYNHIRSKVCPFCGLVAFDHPGIFREDLDHYLPESLYPFASINLWNLAPMCDKCNKKVKKGADLLWNGTTRRAVINPFSHGEISLRLMNSPPQGGTSPYIPNWNIEFKPSYPGLDAWLEVFDVQARYRNKILDDYYDDVIKDIASWCRNSIGVPPSYRALARSVTSLMANLRDDGLKDRAFIRYAIARLVRQQCIAGNLAIINPIVQSINYDTLF